MPCSTRCAMRPACSANIVGAVLNKVDMAAMSRYDSYGAIIIMVELGASDSVN